MEFSILQAWNRWVDGCLMYAAVYCNVFNMPLFTSLVCPGLAFWSERCLRNDSVYRMLVSCCYCCHWPCPSAVKRRLFPSPDGRSEDAKSFGADRSTRVLHVEIQCSRGRRHIRALYSK